MGTRSQPLTADVEFQRLVETLKAAGFPSDDQLDAMFGLDICDPLVEGLALLKQRCSHGPSAEDVAEAATFGDVRTVEPALETLPASGRHARRLA